MKKQIFIKIGKLSYVDFSKVFDEEVEFREYVLGMEASLFNTYINEFI